MLKSFTEAFGGLLWQHGLQSIQGIDKSSQGALLGDAHKPQQCARSNNDRHAASQGSRLNMDGFRQAGCSATDSGVAGRVPAGGAGQDVEVPPRGSVELKYDSSGFRTVQERPEDGQHAGCSATVDGGAGLHGQEPADGAGRAESQLHPPGYSTVNNDQSSRSRSLPTSPAARPIGESEPVGEEVDWAVATSGHHGTTSQGRAERQPPPPGYSVVTKEPVANGEEPGGLASPPAAQSPILHQREWGDGKHAVPPDGGAGRADLQHLGPRSCAASRRDTDALDGADCGAASRRDADALDGADCSAASHRTVSATDGAACGAASRRTVSAVDGAVCGAASRRNVNASLSGAAPMRAQLVQDEACYGMPPAGGARNEPPPPPAAPLTLPPRGAARAPTTAPAPRADGGAKNANSSAAAGLTTHVEVMANYAAGVEEPTHRKAQPLVKAQGGQGRDAAPSPHRLRVKVSCTHHDGHQPIIMHGPHAKFLEATADASCAPLPLEAWTQQGGRIGDSRVEAGLKVEPGGRRGVNGKSSSVALADNVPARGEAWAPMATHTPASAEGPPLLTTHMHGAGAACGSADASANASVTTYVRGTDAASGAACVAFGGFEDDLLDEAIISSVAVLARPPAPPTHGATRYGCAPTRKPLLRAASRSARPPQAATSPRVGYMDADGEVHVEAADGLDSHIADFVDFEDEGYIGAAGDEAYACTTAVTISAQGTPSHSSVQPPFDQGATDLGSIVQSPLGQGLTPPPGLTLAPGLSWAHATSETGVRTAVAIHKRAATYAGIAAATNEARGAVAACGVTAEGGVATTVSRSGVDTACVATGMTAGAADHKCAGAGMGITACADGETAPQPTLLPPPPLSTPRYLVQHGHRLSYHSPAEHECQVVKECGAWSLIEFTCGNFENSWQRTNDLIPLGAPSEPIQRIAGTAGECGTYAAGDDAGTRAAAVIGGGGTGAACSAVASHLNPDATRGVIVDMGEGATVAAEEGAGAPSVVEKAVSGLAATQETPAAACPKPRSERATPAPLAAQGKHGADGIGGGIAAVMPHGAGGGSFVATVAPTGAAIAADSSNAEPAGSHTPSHVTPCQRASVEPGLPGEAGDTRVAPHVGRHGLRVSTNHGIEHGVVQGIVCGIEAFAMKCCEAWTGGDRHLALADALSTVVPARGAVALTSEGLGRIALAENGAAADRTFNVPSGAAGMSIATAASDTSDAATTSGTADVSTAAAISDVRGAAAACGAADVSTATDTTDARGAASHRAENTLSSAASHRTANAVGDGALSGAASTDVVAWLGRGAKSLAGDKDSAVPHANGDYTVGDHGEGGKDTTCIATVEVVSSICGSTTGADHRKAKHSDHWLCRDGGALSCVLSPLSQAPPTGANRGNAEMCVGGDVSSSGRDCAASSQGVNMLRCSAPHRINNVLSGAASYCDANALDGAASDHIDKVVGGAASTAVTGSLDAFESEHTVAAQEKLADWCTVEVGPADTLAATHTWEAPGTGSLSASIFVQHNDAHSMGVQRRGVAGYVGREHADPATAYSSPPGAQLAKSPTAGVDAMSAGVATWTAEDNGATWTTANDGGSKFDHLASDLRGVTYTFILPGGFKLIRANDASDLDVHDALMADSVIYRLDFADEICDGSLDLPGGGLHATGTWVIVPPSMQRKQARRGNKFTYDLRRVANPDRCLARIVAELSKGYKRADVATRGIKLGASCVTNGTELTAGQDESWATDGVPENHDSRTRNIAAMHGLDSTAVPTSGRTIALGDITNVATCVRSGAVGAASTVKRVAGHTLDKHAGVRGVEVGLTAGRGIQAASPRCTNASGSMIIAAENASLLKDGYATSDDTPRCGNANFNFEGAANGQAVGAQLTGVDVHMCPMMGMEKPRCTPPAVGPVYDAPPYEPGGGFEIYGPNETNLVVRKVACAATTPGVGDVKYVAGYYTMDKSTLSTAQRRLYSSARGAGGALSLISTATVRGPRGAWGPWGVDGGKGYG